MRDPFCRRSDISLTHGCALAEDKTVSERHRYHFAWLCDIASAQIAAYDVHRRDLATHLAADGDPRSRFLAALLAAADRRVADVPYLFLLARDGKGRLQTHSVRPKTLGAETAGIWTQPFNLGRHLIATRLAQSGVPRAWIAATLNHLDDLIHPFGRTSVLSPGACGEAMRPALQALGESLGWQVLEGLPRRAGVTEVARWSGEPLTIHEEPELGPELRERARRRHRERDIAAVREVMGPNGLEAARDAPGLIDEWRTLLVRGAGDHAARAARRIALMWRYLRRFGGSKIQRYLPRRTAVPEPEPSPIGRDALDRLRSGHRLAGAFSDYLLARAGEGTSVDPAARVMELCLHAAIWGGVADGDRLAELAAALPKGIYASSDMVWVEIPREADPRPVWRWYPDSRGRALLQGLRRSLRQRERPPGPKLVARELARWVNTHVSPLEPVRQEDAYQWVAWAASGLWIHYAPSVVAEVARGATVSQPLPLSTLVRLLTERRLAPTPESESSREVTPVAMPPSSPADRERGPRDFLRALYSAMAAAENAEAKGAQRRRTQTKARLADALRELGEQRWPPVAAMVLAWGIHLCEQGTRYKRDLAASTPVTYLRTVAMPLCESAWYDDPLESDEQDLEETYQRALSYGSRIDGGAYLAGRLQELHVFAAGYLGVADIDPSVFAGVESAGKRPARLPDANLLWPREYERVLDLIESLADASHAQRQLAIAVAVLGYRFGLRRGEIQTLLAADLWIGEGDDCYVHAHPSVYGDRKSPAATRTVPLIGTLSPRERGALEALAERGRMLFEGDPHAPLFARSSGHGRDLELFDSFAVLGRAMRQVTGDRGLRAHQLRHSLPNRLLVTLLGRGSPEAAAWNRMHDALALPGVTPQRARLLLTGEEALTSTTLHAVAVVLGHTEISTTLAHYVHIADAWIPAALELPALP